MAKTWFDVYYSATDEIIAGLKKPGRSKMIKRAAERAADELEAVKVQNELRRTDLLKKLSVGLDENEAVAAFKELAEIEIEATEADALITQIKAVKDKLFSPAGEED